jgi:hypothetical protein
MNKSRNKFLIAVLIVSLIGIYFGVNKIANQRFAVLESQLNSQINAQFVTLEELAKRASRGEVSEKNSEIVTDCSNSERTDFDRLLSLLDKGLKVEEMEQLGILFSSCGDSYAKKRMSMSLELEREVEVLVQLVSLKRTLTEEEELEVKLSNWKSLVASERKISEVFSELTKIQEQIISDLISKSSGKPADVDQALLQEADKLKVELTISVAEAAKARAILAIP